MLSMEETHKIHFLFTEFSITQIFIKFTLVLFCFYTLIFISEYCLNNCSLVKDENSEHVTQELLHHSELSVLRMYFHYGYICLKTDLNTAIC